MAKSKSGGTRSYLRGRIASDVYSIGRDASGKKQQVVRSLAEQVKNPQTLAQMRGRMIMSTVMQAVSGLAALIDHSFDNVPNGQPSVSEFIRRNYALIKADVASHPSSDNTFGLNKYQEKGVKAGNYIISDGSAILPSFVVTDDIADAFLSLTIPESAATAGAIRTALGLSENDFLTMVHIDTNGKAEFYRVSVSNALADDTAITQANVANLFTIDNPLLMSVSVTFSAGKISFSDSNNAPVACGVIFSQAIDGGYSHSRCVLSGAGGYSFNADTAIATYPIGEERFLNGGEI